MGWLLLFALIEVVMWPLGVMLFGAYTWTTLPLDVFAGSFVLMVAIYVPIFWVFSTGILALFTATMEVLDREHQ